MGWVDYWLKDGSRKNDCSDEATKESRAKVSKAKKERQKRARVTFASAEN